MEPSRRTGGNDNDDEEEDSSRASDEIAAVASNNMALINIKYFLVFSCLCGLLVWDYFAGTT